MASLGSTKYRLLGLFPYAPPSYSSGTLFILSLLSFLNQQFLQLVIRLVDWRLAINLNLPPYYAYANALNREVAAPRVDFNRREIRVFSDQCYLVFAA